MTPPQSSASLACQPTTCLLPLPFMAPQAPFALPRSVSLWACCWLVAFFWLTYPANPPQLLTEAEAEAAASGVPVSSLGDVAAVAAAGPLGAQIAKLRREVRALSGGGGGGAGSFLFDGPAMSVSVVKHKTTVRGNGSGIARSATALSATTVRQHGLWSCVCAG